MDLDSLVIAVRSGTAVVDHADGAVRELQHNDRGIHVVVISEVRIGQAGAEGGDFHDVAVCKVAGHVDIMDHHIHEDTAGNSDIGHGRAFRIAGSDLDDVSLAELAGSSCIVNSLVVRIKAADETDLKLDACLLDSGKSLVDLLDVRVDRLLAEDILACVRGLDNEISMRVGGGADEHCIHVRAVEDVGRILGALRDADALRELFHCLVHERIGKDHHFRVLDQILDVRRMEFADAAAAEHPNLTVVSRRRNIGGNANIVRAFELADRKYIWVLCDDDDFDWSQWPPVERALASDEYDIVYTVSHVARPSDSPDVGYLAFLAAFVPGCIYRTAHITGDVLQGDVETVELYRSAKEKFDIFHVAINDPGDCYKRYAIAIRQSFGRILGKRLKVSTLDELPKTILECLEDVGVDRANAAAGGTDAETVKTENNGRGGLFGLFNGLGTVNW